MKERARETEEANDNEVKIVCKDVQPCLSSIRFQQTQSAGRARIYFPCCLTLLSMTGWGLVEAERRNRGSSSPLLVLPTVGGGSSYISLTSFQRYFNSQFLNLCPLRSLFLCQVASKGVFIGPGQEVHSSNCSNLKKMLEGNLRLKKNFISQNSLEIFDNGQDLRLSYW